MWEDPSFPIPLFNSPLSVTPGNTQGIVYSFFPIALISDTLFLIRGRFSTGSRLSLADHPGHYVVGGNGASHRHGQAVVFLHGALHSTGARPDQPNYGSGHSVPGSLDPSRVPTHSPCTSYKVT